MNKVRALERINILYEGEEASRFYSKIRLAIEKEELEGRKKTIECLYWPKNVIAKKKESEIFFRKKDIKTKAELRSFGIYVVTKAKYNELKEGKDKLAYTRFGNLRNYFVIKRLQLLSQEEKKRLEVSFAIREIVIDRKKDYYIEERTIKEWQSIEDGLWSFNSDKGFMTKIPAFFGPLIFIELGMFRGKKITIKDRKTVSSRKNTDDRTICTRFVIERDEKSLYYKAAELTYQNLRKLVNDKELLKKCRKYMRKYDREKKGI